MTETVAISPKIILLDIEGTTTSISFVKDVMFPYVQDNLESFLKSNFDTPAVQEVISALRRESVEDSHVHGKVLEIPESGKEEILKATVAYLRWQMSKDLKREPLKTLQGLIYPEGFESGVLKSHVYDDFPPALERWKQAGVRLFIYSSGSVPAQKLLFGHTEHGDLTSYFSGYFDTKIGAKVESASYRAIAKEIKEEPQNITFFTDAIREVEAAKEAGVNVVITVRPGNSALTEEQIRGNLVIRSFDQIQIE